MTLGKALLWALLIQGTMTILATSCWLATGDWSFDIGVTFALVPTMLLGLYLGYRMVKARVGDLMPFVVAVVATVPALIVGWSGYQSLRQVIGRKLGPMPVERYAELEHRNAAEARLTGRLRWKDGASIEMEQGGAKVKYVLLPFVPVSWKAGEPVPVWVLGTTHRRKRADFDDCTYDAQAEASPPCTLRLLEPRQRELRLRLIRLGVVPALGGMDFVVLRADVDPLWLPRWLALSVGLGGFLLLTLWILRLGRQTARRHAQACTPSQERPQAATDPHPEPPTPMPPRPPDEAA